MMSAEASQAERSRSEVAVAHKMVHDGASSVMVTEEGKLVGIVNRLDLCAAVVDNEAEEDASNLPKRASAPKGSYREDVGHPIPEVVTAVVLGTRPVARRQEGGSGRAEAIHPRSA
jgi:CBS domain-containing protein